MKIGLFVMETRRKSGFARHDPRVTIHARMNQDNSTWTKTDLRRSMRARLAAVDENQLAEWSARLVKRLQMRREIWEKPGTAALFGGLRAEPDLVSTLMPWLAGQGWQTVFFRISEGMLEPRVGRAIGSLRRGRMGVWEPSMQTSPVPVGELTVILVPGLMFSTKDGSRLGHGGGYYDRLLSQQGVRAPRLGVAFDAQLAENLPCEPHDMRVQSLATESRFVESFPDG